MSRLLRPYTELSVVMELIELLKKSLLFSGLADSDLAELAAITVRRKFSKGETLFCEGEEATGFYLLVSGSVKMCRLSADGREKVLHFVKPRETFAEAAFFGDGKYPAEARAQAAGEVLYIPRNGFLELIGRKPKFYSQSGGLPFPDVAPVCAPDRGAILCRCDVTAGLVPGQEGR